MRTKKSLGILFLVAGFIVSLALVVFWMATVPMMKGGWNDGWKVLVSAVIVFAVFEILGFLLLIRKKALKTAKNA
ncbi:hypothetical protein CMI37_26340 [Candidatus Pacearchaeota archaeon]|nr:hypothetical protein [Candidatus Pacearchaeota archaeon]